MGETVLVKLAERIEEPLKKCLWAKPCSNGKGEPPQDSISIGPKRARRREKHYTLEVSIVTLLGLWPKGENDNWSRSL